MKKKVVRVSCGEKKRLRVIVVSRRKAIKEKKTRKCLFLWSGVQVPRALEQAMQDMQRESNKSGVIGLCGAVHGRKDLIRGPGKARPFHSGKASLSNQF